MDLYMYTYMHVDIYVMYVHMYVHMFVYLYMYICVYVYVYACMHMRMWVGNRVEVCFELVCACTMLAGVLARAPRQTDKAKAEATHTHIFATHCFAKLPPRMPSSPCHEWVSSAWQCEHALPSCHWDSESKSLAWACAPLVWCASGSPRPYSTTPSGG